MPQLLEKPTDDHHREHDASAATAIPRHPLPRVALLLPSQRRVRPARPVRVVEVEPESKEAARSRLREYLIISESDPAIEKAYGALRNIVKALTQAGRYRDARSVLLLAIGLHCRTRFVFETGREEASGADGMVYARKLRSMNVLSQTVYRRFRLVCEGGPPYDERHVLALTGVARGIEVEVKIPAKGGVAA